MERLVVSPLASPTASPPGRRMSLRKSEVLRELESSLFMSPGKVDIETVEKQVQEAQELNIDRIILTKIQAKLHKAHAAQDAKRRLRAIEELESATNVDLPNVDAARVRAASNRLEALINAPTYKALSSRRESSVVTESGFGDDYDSDVCEFSASPSSSRVSLTDDASPPKLAMRSSSFLQQDLSLIAKAKMLLAEVAAVSLAKAVEGPLEKLDIFAARKAVASARRDGVDNARLDGARSRMREAAAVQLMEQVKVPLEELREADLRAALALAEEEGVVGDPINAANRRFAEAEALAEAKRAEEARQAQLLFIRKVEEELKVALEGMNRCASRTILKVEVEDLAQAISKVEEACDKIDRTMDLSKPSHLLTTVRDRDAASSLLPHLLTLPADSLNIDELRSACVRAMRSGVELERVQAGLSLLRAAEGAQAEVRLVIERLEKARNSNDLISLRSAKAAAMAMDGELPALKAALEKAEKDEMRLKRERAKLDSASKDLLMLIAPLEWKDLGAVRHSIERCGKLGLSGTVMEMARARLTEVESFVGCIFEDKEKETQARMLAANRRSIASIRRRSEQAQKDLAEKQEAAAAAAAAVQQATSAVESRRRTAREKMKEASEMDRSLLLKIAEEAQAIKDGDENEMLEVGKARERAEERCLKARAEAAMAESELGELLTSLFAARGAEVNANQAEVLAREAMEQALDQAGVIMRDLHLVDHKPIKRLTTNGALRKKGGCCGGAVEDVIEDVKEPSMPMPVTPEGRRASRAETPSLSERRGSRLENEGRRGSRAESPIQNERRGSRLESPSLNGRLSSRLESPGPNERRGSKAEVKREPPMPIRLDELAFSPLLLEPGSAAQVELSVKLALLGMFEDPELCEVIADEIVGGSLRAAAAVLTRVVALFISAAGHRKASGGHLALSSVLMAPALALRSLTGSRGSREGAALRRGESAPLPKQIENHPSHDSGALLRQGSSKKAMIQLLGMVGSGKFGSGRMSVRSSRLSLRLSSRASMMDNDFPELDMSSLSPSKLREMVCGINVEALVKLVRTWLNAMGRKPQPPHDSTISSAVNTLLTAELQPFLPHALLEPCLVVLLRRHHQLLQYERDKTVMPLPPGKEGAAKMVASSIRRSLSKILGLSMLSIERFRQMMPHWLDEEGASPAIAIADVAEELVRYVTSATDYMERLERGRLSAEDIDFQRKVLALVVLFVERPATMTGFQNLVPQVFDVFLAKGTLLRGELCSHLKEGGVEDRLVERIAVDDELVRQKFFWSSAGMKLFGGELDLSNPDKLVGLLEDALRQQPAIVCAFLEDGCAKAASKSPERIAPLLQLTIRSTLHTARLGASPALNRVVEALLLTTNLHYNLAYKPAINEWSQDVRTSAVLIDSFASEFQTRLHKSALPREGEAPASEEAMRDLAVIEMLAAMFIQRPNSWTAFGKLVPDVFDTHLRLGSAPRTRLNQLLLQSAFEPRLEGMLGTSDDLVKSTFFWNAEVMPLCTRERIAKSYSRLNACVGTRREGGELHLYSSLLALLLKLSSHRGGEPHEIARRTKEVLDQFERNEDQQQFMLAIIERLEERSRAQPSSFDEVELTVLSEVAQNGVHTLSSMQGEGMALCSQAMTTLLRTYIDERPPSSWKSLFKEATNVGFMVKYMFREDLRVAKEKFAASVHNKEDLRKMGSASDSLEFLQELTEATLRTYGDIGIYDVTKLADIDFINRPELLVKHVDSSVHLNTSDGDEEMQLLIKLTTAWMELMVERGFPPLTPHHTQALTVLMASEFLKGVLAVKRGQPASKIIKKLKLRSLVAQLGTGEGKSIVIAMLAIFVCRLYGMRVHVLENNAGLLERDFRTNKPFFDKFNIKSGIDLDEPGVQICYCLKANINKRFLRKLVEGKLEEELGNTVLIVDEVDDLIINERPNSHYVKKDVELTPDLCRCFDAIKNGCESPPEGVREQTWQEALGVKQYCETMVKRDRHYRVVEDEPGVRQVIMLDEKGHRPKVPLTSPWLNYLNFEVCGVEPQAQSRYACVCTPYIFNKYVAIFGLTGSVGGAAELAYLARTYRAIKFNVPRFLDTCVGDARKEVVNLGVEVTESQSAMVDRVVDLANQYYRLVPVLVVSSSLDELKLLHETLALRGDMPSDEIQRLSEFDADGKSMRGSWQTIIDDATKRIGGVGEARCRVTVTDRFGGRGHDYQVVDKEANENGGMLVIATSVPDEREWIQWKGRTGRQDRPGQFCVVLNQQAKPFNDPKHAKLVEKLKGTGKASAAKEPISNDAKIAMLLEVADDRIRDRLREFESEQAIGEKLNLLTELYYKRYPRDLDEPWPSERFYDTDVVLRTVLTNHTKTPPKEITRIAKLELDIDLP